MNERLWVYTLIDVSYRWETCNSLQGLPGDRSRPSYAWQFNLSEKFVFYPWCNPQNEGSRRNNTFYNSEGHPGRCTTGFAGISKKPTRCRKNPSVDIGMDGRSLARLRERPHLDIAGFHLHM